MPSPNELIALRLRQAFATLDNDADPILRPSDHADFQANGALALAKRLGRNPTDVASEVIAAANLEDWCERVEVSGPGFINLTFSTAFLATSLLELEADPRLGVPVASSPST